VDEAMKSIVVLEILFKETGIRNSGLTTQPIQLFGMGVFSRVLASL
jgi:hypothetical protein